jgi:hypothetical protein
MTILLKILGLITDGFSFLKKHPKFFLGIVVALFIVLFFRQCETNRILENEIEQLNIELKNEEDRTINNITALKDSVVKLDNQNTYYKGVLRIKDGEVEVLSTRLQRTNKKVQELTEELKNAKVKNIYVTDITSDVSTNDVLTNVTLEDSNTFSLGIHDSTSIFSLNTQTWFKIVPNNNKLKLELLDRYGEGKSSQLDYKFNFTLTTSQIELPDGNTRILIKPTDINGNEIPSSLLTIPFADGVDFIDVKPQIITPPLDKKRRGFSVVVGPTGGISYMNGQFLPSLGVGVTVGYRIW